MIDIALGALTAGATVAIAVAAWRQLPFIANQVRALASQIEQGRKSAAAEEGRERIRRTVAIVERHDTDPIFEAACQRVWNASEEGRDYSKANRRDLILIVNYFTSMAIGIKQCIYDETIIKDNLSSSVKKAVEQIIHPGYVEPDHHQALLSLYNDWFPPSDLPAYKKE